MAFWFYRGLRKGIATTRYPDAIDAWTRRLPGPPVFHSTRLTTGLADRLARECPSGALTREDGELMLDLGRCTGCGICLEHGEGVARPSGDFQLAATDRDGLLKRVPIRGDRQVRGVVR